MVYNPQRAVPQSSETLANSEDRNKRLERLSELSQQTLTKYCDYIMAYQYRKIIVLSWLLWRVPCYQLPGKCSDSFNKNWLLDNLS